MSQADRQAQNDGDDCRRRPLADLLARPGARPENLRKNPFLVQVLLFIDGNQDVLRRHLDSTALESADPDRDIEYLCERVVIGWIEAETVGEGDLMKHEGLRKRMVLERLFEMEDRPGSPEDFLVARFVGSPAWPQGRDAFNRAVQVTLEALVADGFARRLPEGYIPTQAGRRALEWHADFSRRRQFEENRG